MRDADPQGDADALERLAVWALKRYAPVCQTDPPDGLAIDATGAAHLKGGEAAMLADMVHRLAEAGVRAEAAIAPAYGAAHALARFRRDLRIVDDGGIDAAIGPLPLEALRLSGDLIAGLRRMGFERIADVAHRPRAPWRSASAPIWAVASTRPTPARESL
ncbi:hypothetical protein [Brevundimonas aurantiaca]|uniref:hypothetical protein n=1 Tax=Brevundimonas aurantiaca TaxID=74316 RepID=UPI001CD595F6|nr:hypothetical protein [Brevundimonas aurantiaca]